MDAHWIALLLTSALMLPVAWGVGHELWEGRGGRRFRTLLIHDGDPLLNLVAAMLADEGYRLEPCDSSSAVGRIQRVRYHLIVTALGMAELDSRGVLPAVTEGSPGSHVILVGEPMDVRAGEAGTLASCTVLDRRLPPPVLAGRVRTALQGCARGTRSRPATRRIATVTP